MSLPHSGSTLCGSLLGGHSQAFCLGEPWKMRSYARLERESTHKTALGNACTCGAPDIWQCSFWPKVDLAVAARSGRSLRDLDLASGEPDVFRRDNKLLFDAVAEVSGATLLVDSSKRVGRLRKLLSADFAPVKVLHLVRDPRGQVLSNMKRSGRGPYRHALRYARDTWDMARIAAHADSIQVRYEALADRPAEWLAEIMPQLGLVYEPEQLDWAALERHNISGNKSRATSSSAIRTDRSWQNALNVFQQSYITAVTSPVMALTGVRA